MKTENYMHDNKICLFQGFSWAPVIVGGLVGIGLSFLLNLFAAAIGLSLVTTNQTGMSSLAIGGFLGLLIGSLVIMFMCGFSAGYLGKNYNEERNLGVLYGFTAWCASLILLILLTSPFVHYIEYYSYMVAHPTLVHVSDAMMQSQYVQSTSNGMSSMQSEAKILGLKTFLIFVLFFLGAVASCFGGYYGMMTNSDDN